MAAKTQPRPKLTPAYQRSRTCVPWGVLMCVLKQMPPVLSKYYPGYVGILEKVEAMDSEIRGKKFCAGAKRTIGKACDLFGTVVPAENASKKHQLFRLQSMMLAIEYLWSDAAGTCPLWAGKLPDWMPIWHWLTACNDRLGIEDEDARADKAWALYLAVYELLGRKG